MVGIIKAMEKKNDFKGLVGYPYQFALAWKAPANLKEAGVACKECGEEECVCEASSKEAAEDHPVPAFINAIDKLKAKLKTDLAPNMDVKELPWQKMTTEITNFSNLLDRYFH